MDDTSPLPPSRGGQAAATQATPSSSEVDALGPPSIHVHQPSRPIWPWLLLGLGLLGAFVGLGLLLVAGLIAAVNSAADQLATTSDDSVIESYIEGPSRGKTHAIIEISGTIGPPFTDDWLAQIEKATEDDDIVGVLLHVDSPGGLVADSHQIYHRLIELSEKKPIVVQFGRLAASGGYYVAMGAGPDGTIVAEPTTWTGSIGVIVPYYNVTELAEQVGVKAAPLKTGQFKDTLSPFKPLTEDEEEVWDEIIADAFDRFKDVIEGTRTEMTREQIEAAATGQIFTAEQAVERRLVDRIGFRDDALAVLAEKTGIKRPRVIRYDSPASPFSMLLGEATASESDWMQLLRTARPEAHYLYGWPATAVPR